MSAIAEKKSMRVAHECHSRKKKLSVAHECHSRKKKN